MGSGNEIVDYSRALCLGADQKTRGLWDRNYLKTRVTLSSIQSKFELKTNPNSLRFPSLLLSLGLIGSLDLLSVLCHNFDFGFAIFICNFWRSVLAVAVSRVVVLKIVEQEMARREISNKLLGIYFITTS